MVLFLINLKEFFFIHLQLLYLCFIYIKSITQDIKIAKLPYLSINNNNNSSSSLRKLYLPSNIYGSAFGLNYYYTNLYLGDEMKKQTYILDTGSTITTAPCQPYCIKCGNHLNSYHNVKDSSKVISCNDDKCRMVKSSCDKDNTCSFKTSYSEGSSLSGIYINELIRFGEDYNSKEGDYVPIGCTTSEDNLFYTQKADGIMGLGNNENNFISILNKVGAIENTIFGLCLAQMGGYFSIGEINNTFHREEITYLKMEKISFFFSLNMNKIYVNDKMITKYSKNKYSLIIDSGTTISYFPEEIFNEMVTNIKSICSSSQNRCGYYEYDRDFGPCFSFDSRNQMEEAVYKYWPNISFILEDYKYNWTPDEYLFNDTNKMKIRGCMGFNKGGGKRFTMGSTWMIGHEIIFDRKNNRIGIVEANCDKNNNKTMNIIGIEKGYKENIIGSNNGEKASLIDFIFNENMLNFYIIISIILLLVIIYLVIVLIQFKKRKRNAWLWFMEKEENIEEEENNLIPIKYDINDSSNKYEKNNIEFSNIYLENHDNNNQDFKNSKYSQIIS